MKTSSSPRRAALDPSLSLHVDRYECSMAIATPQSEWRPLHRLSRTVMVGLGAVAATIGGYFLQVGR